MKPSTATTAESELHMANGEPGAPENNDNAVTHGLFQQRDSLRDNLSAREERMLVDIAQDLLDRFPDGAHIGAYERAAIEEIALDTIKRQRFNEYILDEDQFDNTENTDRVNRVYTRIVKQTTSELEKLGLLQEGPEMRKAEASESWMEAISEATEQASE